MHAFFANGVQLIQLTQTSSLKLLRADVQQLATCIRACSQIVQVCIVYTSCIMSALTSLL
jgi:hypothetical protein